MKSISRITFAPWLRVGLLTLVMLILAGCVTTSTSSPQQVDLDKAEKTHVQAGLAYLRQDDRESARRHFEKALELNKRSAGAYNGLAYLYWSEQNLERAESFFRKALSLQPDFSRASNNYGSFLYSQMRYEEAEKYFKKVTEDYRYDSRHLALLNLGRTELKLGKSDAALASFRQAIGINRRVAAPYLELAELYFDAKNYPLARQHFDQYSQLAGQTSRSLWLGIRLEQIYGDKDKKASYALALKNLYPDSAEYLEYVKSANE